MGGTKYAPSRVWILCNARGRIIHTCHGVRSSAAASSAVPPHPPDPTTYIGKWAQGLVGNTHNAVRAVVEIPDERI